MATTVDKIRLALEKRDGIAEDQMRPLADAYREQVQQVNQRLDEAVMLLRKGLRSEAIQRVGMTPNALDSAAELEFPEWDEWNEILQFMGIPLPPKLNQDYVAQINEAIIESLPLDALLRRHRRLAIAKAPLAVRLRTLRQIARVDSNNSVWVEDVEAWEKVRLSQVDGELKQALDREDSATLYQLHQELTTAPWRTKPAPRLIEQSAFAAEAHVRDNQRRELGLIAPKLAEAFASRDESAARSLRSQWQTARAKYNVPVSKELQAAVAPTLQWLEDLDRQSVMEDERHSAIAALESLLASGAPLVEVQKAYDHAASFGQPIPEEISNAVAELASRPARQAKRKTLIITGALAAAAVVALVGGLIYLKSVSDASAREETVRQMEQFVSLGQYDEAARYFESVQSNAPVIAELPRMVALHAQAKKAVDDEAFRLERFQNLIGQAASDDPALIDESLFPQLDELAASPGEQGRVDELKSRKNRYNAEMAIKQSDQMVAEVGQLQRTFTQLQGRGSSRENRDAIQQLLNSVSRLPMQYPRHNDAALAKQTMLQDRVAATLQQMKDMSSINDQRREAIDALANSRSLEVYADRLREFATQSVARTGFIEFVTVIDEEDHWLAVERLNAWLADLQAKLQRGLTTREAVALLESGTNLRREVSPNPVFERLSDFDQTMNEIESRQAILDNAFARLAKHPLSRLVSLQADENGVATNHLIYDDYAKENAERIDRAGSIGVSVVSDAIGGVRNRAFQGPLNTVLQEPMKSVTELIGQRTSLAIDFDQKWEQTFLVLVSDVLRNDQLDGNIKEYLIYELLTAATRGSERLKALIPQTMQILQRRSDVRENWYQPRPFDASLSDELDGMLRAELKIAYQRFSEPLQGYQSVADKRFRWIGFLSKSVDGTIEASLREPLAEQNGTLYVAAPPREAEARTAIFSVGELKRGHIQLIPNPVHQVPGRPLFLLPD